MILDKDYPPDPRVRSEALTLVAGGHEVHLFCMEYESRKLYEILEGVHVHRFRINHKFYKKIHALVYSVPVFSCILKSKISKYLDSQKFDVVHIHDMIIAGTAIPLAKKRNISVTLDLHENRPAIMHLYSHVNSGLGKVLISIKKWEKMQCKLALMADKIITVTEEAKQDLANSCGCNPDKIDWLPNTINLKAFRKYPFSLEIAKRYENRFMVLYLGNTGLRRGTETAIRAIGKLVNKIDNILLVLVGSSRDDSFLHDVVKECDLENYVEQCGWQDESLFPSYLAEADVCLSPLKRNRHHDTTYANKLFQYMSAGKPVIVSDCTAQANVVKETECGLVHKANSIDDLAEKIHYIYNNREDARTMSKNGKKAVEDKYNWDLTGKKLLEIYK